MNDSRSVSGGIPAPSPAVSIGSGDAQAVRTQPEPAPIPVVSAPATSYPYHPANRPQEPQGDKHNSKLLFIGIILCVMALVALAAILFLVLARPFDHVDAPAPPEISEVERAFDNAVIQPPNLSDLMYVTSTDLSDPELADFKTGSVTEDAGAKGSFVCDGQASATFQNESVKAVVPLTVKMTHAAESTNWVSGGVEEGDPDVSPTGPADIQAIQANFPNILKAYDQNVAAQFADAEVRPEASLTAQGGTVVFNLSKTVDEEVKTCTVNADVAWGNQGWSVKVSNIAGLEEPAAEEEGGEEPAQASEEPVAVPTFTPPSSSSEGSNAGSNGGGGSGSTDLYPTMLLECWSGDLVRVPGTIQVQSNGSVLLRTDDVIQVIFDGKTYITTYFELTGVGSFQNGQHVMVDGAITANGSNPIAPLVINMGWY